MPIASLKGMSTRGQAFPQIGNIRKGAPKKPNGHVGADLKWFRFEVDPIETDAADIIAKAFGPEPNPIDAFMPFPTVEENFDNWYEAYQASRLIGRSEGPGGIIVKLLDHQTGEWVVSGGKCVVPFGGHNVGDVVLHTKYAGKDAAGKGIPWKPVGRLKVVIPQLHRAVYLMLHTTSILDIVRIDDALQNCYTHISPGELRGVPMLIRRSPVKIRYPDPKNPSQRKTTEKWLISIEIHPAYFQRKHQALEQGADPLLLQGGDDVGYKVTQEGGEQVIDMQWSEIENDTDDDLGVHEFEDSGKKPYVPPPDNDEKVEALVDTIDEMKAELDEQPPPPTAFEKNDLPRKRNMDKSDPEVWVEGDKRPYTGFVTKTRLVKKMDNQKVEHTNPTKRQVNGLYGAFSALFDLERGSVELETAIAYTLDYLVGVRKIEKLNNVQYEIIRTLWLEAEWRNGTWHFNQHAKAEAENCRQCGLKNEVDT
jgi:hypothetical protein